MTYLKHHHDCQPGCMVYTSYIRIKNKWHKVGKYHTKCGQFQSDIESTKTADPIVVKPEADASNNSITQRYLNLYPFQISDKELLELCNSLRKA